MAYIKIFPIKVTDKKALDYIMNPDKTEEKLLISSFACSPESADEVLKGKYEYVISTHVDQDHIHNHIIFNATSFVDHHKYVSNKRSYHKICRISNRICQENGLVTSMPTGEKGKSYKEKLLVTFPEKYGFLSISHLM